jgi:hypothetical protein
MASFKKYVTLEGGGGKQSVTPPFLVFETLFVLLLEGNIFVTKQDKASIGTLFWIYSIFQSNIGLKISHQKLKNVTQGRGGRKVPKKTVTYYLNGP